MQKSRFSETQIAAILVQQEKGHKIADIWLVWRLAPLPPEEGMAGVGEKILAKPGCSTSTIDVFS